MIRKAIQYFRYANTDENIRDVMLASLVMAHEEAGKFYEEIELWTDIEGKSMLTSLPVSWSSVRLLPGSKNVNAADKATILAAQDRPFILLKEYVFMAMPLSEDKVSRNAFVYALTKDAGTEYVYDTNIRRLNVAGVAVDIPDWQTECGINGAICGGPDHSFWKEYGLYIQKVLSANPALFGLQPGNFQYLVDSWLLKVFAKEKGMTLDVLETDFKRIPDVRSTAKLLRFNMQLPVVVVPPSMLSFVDIREFIRSLLQVRHPALAKKFHALERHQQFSIHNLPSSELSFFKDLADDAKHYDDRRARLLDAIAKNDIEDFSIHPFSLENFRENIDVTLATSALTDVVETHWDWRHGIRVHELGKLKWLANTVTPAEKYTTLISAKPGSTDVVENSIDDLNEIILNVFSVPALLRDGITKIKEHFEESDHDKLFGTITLRIYDLYMLGALQVTPSE